MTTLDTNRVGYATLPTFGTVESPFTREDALLEMLGELPSDPQIEALVNRLTVHMLRTMTTDIFRHDVHAARNRRVDPYSFTEFVSGWWATAQEVAASRRGVGRVLRNRDRMMGQD